MRGNCAACCCSSGSLEHPFLFRVPFPAGPGGEKALGERSRAGAGGEEAPDRKRRPGKNKPHPHWRGWGESDPEKRPAKHLFTFPCAEKLDCEACRGSSSGFRIVLVPAAFPPLLGGSGFTSRVSSPVTAAQPRGIPTLFLPRAKGARIADGMVQTPAPILEYHASGNRVKKNARKNARENPKSQA
jgi:hypothetical protein